MTDISPERALIYAILKGGVAAFQQAKSLGVRAEHLHFDERRIFEICEADFIPRGRMPTLTELKVHYSIEIPSCTESFDVDLCAKNIVRAALITKLSDGLGPVIQTIQNDPYEARRLLTELIQETNWTLGGISRSDTPQVLADLMQGYLDAKARDGSLRGLSSPWPSRDARSLGIQRGEVTVILAKRKTGKCVTGKTLCTDPTTGRMVSIEELVKRRNGQVYTWSKCKAPESTRPSDFIDNGVRDCVRVTFKSGRSIECTPNHPFMTPMGWQPIENIPIGHHVMSVKKLPAPTKPTALYDDEARILGYMVADGGCTGSSTPTWTKTDPDLVADFDKALGVLNGMLTPKADAPGQYYVVSQPGQARSKIVAFLDEFDLLGKKSVEKKIPDVVFSLDDGQLGIFLGRLWSGDGCVDARGNVSYSTGSREMAFQIQHLLLRFGVTSRVYEIYRDNNAAQETRTYYEVLVHKECIDAFRCYVGANMIGEKASRLGDVRFEVRSRIGWLKNEELRAAIRAEMDAQPALLQEVGEELGYTFPFQKGHVFDSKSGRIRKKVFEAFCSVYDSPLKWVLDENIWWDEIESIEPIGPQQVYDLSIPETHCFVANDFVVHNSWFLFKWVQHIWRNKFKCQDGTERPELDPGDTLLVVSLEMPDDQVWRRIYAIDQKLDYELFRAGRLPKAEEDKFFAWHEATLKQQGNTDKPAIMVVGSDRVNTVNDIIGIVAQYRPRAVFIDGLYILECEGKMKSAPMWERISHIMKAIKIQLARGMNVPVVATTQLSGQVKRGDLNAEADAVAYGKSIGDWCDAMDGLFGNDKFRDNGRRILRGMEARDFRTIDLEINFNPSTQDYSEIKVLDRGDSGLDGGGDSDDDDDDDSPPSYTEDMITLD